MQCVSFLQSDSHCWVSNKISNAIDAKLTFNIKDIQLLGQRFYIKLEGGGVDLKKN